MMFFWICQWDCNDFFLLLHSQAKVFCRGCKDHKHAPQHKCGVCKHEFHNSCLTFWHTWKSGVPPPGKELQCKSFRVCGSCCERFKNPDKLKPVVWHNYNKAVWQALKRAKQSRQKYVAPSGRPLLGDIADDANTSATATTTTNANSATATATTNTNSNSNDN